MARDDFSEVTKRKLAMRAGGRCSRPGCDEQCWLPGSEPEGVVSIGVAAHICAASPGGPRYDPKQAPNQRSSLANGIFLCQNCAKLIDADETRFPAEELHAWKKKHEAQIKDTASGVLLLPKVEVRRSIGITVSGLSPTLVTEERIGNRVEHTIFVINNSDFEYRSIGFTIQYPEYIEHPPFIKSPPGCDIQLECENMEWEVFTSGGGSVQTPKITHYGSMTIKTGSLAQGENIEVRLRSVPDPHGKFRDGLHEGMIYYYICGEVRVKRKTMLEKQGFTAPLLYDFENRSISAGDCHDSALHQEKYVQLIRA